ncbi:hypothetical protein OROMI_018946 [Orobanche minor]
MRTADVGGIWFASKNGERDRLAVEYALRLSMHGCGSGIRGFPFPSIVLVNMDVFSGFKGMDGGMRNVFI